VGRGGVEQGGTRGLLEGGGAKKILSFIFKYFSTVAFQLFFVRKFSNIFCPLLFKYFLTVNFYNYNYFYIYNYFLPLFFLEKKLPLFFLENYVYYLNIYD